MGKSSVAWDFFKKTDEGAECTIDKCATPNVKVKNGSTGGLWSHLENNHKEIHGAIKDKKKPPKRPTIVDESQVPDTPRSLKKRRTEEAEKCKLIYLWSLLLIIYFCFSRDVDACTP